MNILKKLNVIVYSILLTTVSLLPFQLQADDTDIYIDPPTPGDEPMVMFVLDWRPNLTSNLGTSVVSNACKSALATASAPPTATDSATITTISSTCGWSEAFVTSLVSTVDVTDAASPSGGINRLELLRAILAQTMSTLDGVKIGLMINHNDSCTGGTTAGPTVSNCSNGAYVMQGFRSVVADDSNNTKANFLNLLSYIPDVSGSGHKFQGKEVYFEMFRYLTGQGVYNGHLGWEDFDNSTTTDNLDGTGGPESPDYSSIAWDTNIEYNNVYNTPYYGSTVCTKVFALNFVFGVVQDQNDSDSAIGASYADGGMNALSMSGGANAQFASVIQWMYNTDLVNGNINMQYVDTTTDPVSYPTTALSLEDKQNVTSYFVVQSPSTAEHSWASAGGTDTAVAWSDDPDEMTARIRSIFNQILSVSTTFVSASVPVNVFNRAEFLDDVYLAVFEAQEDGLPKWIGNLKKLKLQQDTDGRWFIGDAQNWPDPGIPAFASDGRINYNALTFWTDASADDVTNADTDAGEVAGYDGQSINRGGAGQQIAGMRSIGGTIQNGEPEDTNATSSTARQVFTEPTGAVDGTATALMALDATVANATALWSDLNAEGWYASGSTVNNTEWAPGVASYADASPAQQTEALNLIKFARGIDPATGDPRPWIMADPIHSRPLAINYGDSDGDGGFSTTNPDVRIILTSNSGAVHMIQNTTSSGTESGKENWAFYPRYALRLQKRLKDDVAGDPVHPYGVDGAPSLYTEDVNGDGNLKAADGDKVYVFFGMRRGGRHYYALDISDPDDPKMLWRIGADETAFSTDSSGSTVSGLGLTFSRPAVTRVSYDGTTVPVLIFGAGYSPETRDDRSYGTHATRNYVSGLYNAGNLLDTVGRGVYIVNAHNGNLVWKAVYGDGSASGYHSDTEYWHQNLYWSIAADVSVLDSNGNGVTDRFYVGDTAGLIFRGDLAGNRDQWKLTTFACAGWVCNTGYKSEDRRFMHAIDIVQTRDPVSGDAYDAVIVGSGDRANPVDRDIGDEIPQNWFYMFKDYYIHSGTPNTSYIHELLLADLSSNCMQPGEDSHPCDETTLLRLSNYGWKIQLNQATGEKALSRPITLGGTVYFTTYLPPDTSGVLSCGPQEGSGLIYALNLQDATAVLNNDLTNTVTVGDETYELLASDRFREAGAGIPADVIAIRKGGELQAVIPHESYTQSTSGSDGWKTFWYSEGD